MPVLIVRKQSANGFGPGIYCSLRSSSIISCFCSVVAHKRAIFNPIQMIATGLSNREKSIFLVSLLLLPFNLFTFECFEWYPYIWWSKQPTLDAEKITTASISVLPNKIQIGIKHWQTYFILHYIVYWTRNSPTVSIHSIASP